MGDISHSYPSPLMQGTALIWWTFSRYAPQTSVCPAPGAWITLVGASILASPAPPLLVVWVDKAQASLSPTC